MKKGMSMHAIIIIGLFFMVQTVWAGDFNDDNKSDILWQKDTGAYTIWLMDGTTKADNVWIGEKTGWSVKGIGDFNADGKSDILWKKDTGAYLVKLMDESGETGDNIWIGEKTGWSVKGVNDFNNNDKVDILWQKDDGKFVVKLMDETGETGINIWIGERLNWCVQNTDDFNGDGNADILWKKENGNHILWLMTPDNGYTVGDIGNPTWNVQPRVKCGSGGIIGTTLACEIQVIPTSVDAIDFNSSATFKQNISSRDRLGDPNRENPTAHNTIERLDVVVDERNASGDLIEGGDRFHPIAVSYNQQYFGDYEMGLGSADIGDPEHVDAVYFALSQDNGQTWKNMQVTTYDGNISNEANKSSIQVDWNGTIIDYPAHTQKPKMAIEGNRIVVAWNDKFCPSGNPFNLTEVIVDDHNKTYPDDFFAMNGTQGSINYSIDPESGEFVPYYAEFADKYVFEVPFSCVWTARGIFNEETGEVTWHAPIQLTTGTRDSNHIWIEGSEAGFAMAWQEDTIGLKSGKGAGPGEGWSGATTNKGSDIWFTTLKMEDFDANAGEDEDNVGKLKSVNNFHYPVRITDNETCSTNDKKPYCNYFCGKYGFETGTTNNEKNETKERCYTNDWDFLDDRTSVLDGDTGASRSALRIFKTNENEHVVVFGYEETKALTVKETGTGDGNTTDTNISAEGKAVYFESFLFEAIDDLNASNSNIEDVNMPLVSAGDIVNIKAPDQNDSENMIYENARRLVIGTQVDSCDADRFNFAFMYKQSFEVEGDSSDMFIRVNEGFTYDSFVALDENIVTNISAQVEQPEANATNYVVTWSSDNLDDNTYDNPLENTFSPRIFLRGNTIYTGYEYKAVDVEHMPANFHAHIYKDGAWTEMQNITQVTKDSETTVDARFFTTPKGSDSGLDSDQSNPEVLFVTWGNVDFIQPGSPGLGKAEGDLFYKRSTDNGVNWDETKPLAAKDGGWIQEKEVESFASPDGKTIYNVWLQEQEDYNSSDPFSGLDSWFGRVDYNISNIE